MRHWVWIALTTAAIGMIVTLLAWRGAVPASGGSAKTELGAGQPAVRPATTAALSRLITDQGTSQEDVLDEGPEDKPPVVDFDDPASIAAFNNYWARKSRREAEGMAPVIFEDAPRALGLPADKHDAMLALLVGYTVRLNVATHSPGANRVIVAQQLDEIRGSREKELAELLGAERFAALNRYRQTIGARYEVHYLDQRLGLARRGMTEAQRRRIVEAVTQRGALLPDREYSRFESPASVRQEVSSRVEQNDQRLLAAARPVLDDVQFATYADYLEKRRPVAVVDQTPWFAREDIVP